MENVENYYYFRPEYNTWAVFFNNRRKWPTSDVKKMFTKYGPVQRVVQSSSSPTGACFVNFVSESAARDCVLDMKNHSTIKLRQFDPKEFGKSSVNYDKSSRRTNSTPKKNDHKNGYKSDSDFYSSVNSLVLLDLGSTISQKPSEICEPPKAAAPTCPQIPAADVDDQEETYNTIKPSSTPAAVTAQEVIVANIHESCGEGFILDLLKYFKPIAATCVKLIPKYNLRYCHVYFMTPQMAQAVESNYDNVKLCDNNLIVLRADTLIHHCLSEAICST